MKLKTPHPGFFAIILLLITFQSGYCTDSLRIKKLELTSKVWGFVVFKTDKHIAQPDQELLKLIRLADQEESYLLYRNRVQKWAQKNLSPANRSCNCYRDTLPFSMVWVSDTLLLGKSFSNELTIYAQSCLEKGSPQFLIKSGIPQFYRGINSKPNKTDRLYMLLGAIKYWNITNYFYSYLPDCEVNWDHILPQLLLQFDTLQNYTDYFMALLQLSQKLHDGHARIYSTWAADHLFEYEIPCEVEVYEHWAIVTHTDSGCPLKKNDRIIAINHQPIEKCLDYWAQYLSTSTPGWFLHISRNYLFAASDTLMNVVIYRDGEPIPMNIRLVKTRDKREISNDQVYNMSSDSIGYIHLGNLQIHHVALMKQQLQSAKVLIIDAREYPNSTLLALSPWLLNGKYEFARHQTINPNCLGNYLADSSSTSMSESIRYSGTIIFVIDRSTISQGEFMTMAFMQSLNVITMGRSTAGTIGVTTQFELPGEILCRLSTSTVTFPDHSKVQQLGITPMVNWSENENISNSNDLILEAYHYARRIIDLHSK